MNSTVITNTQATAIVPTTGDQEPRCQGPRSNRLLAEPEIGRDDVGDVQADGRDRRDGRIRGGVPQVGQPEDEGAASGEPDGVGGRARGGVQLVPHLGEGQGAVPGEGVDHAGVGRDGRHAAKELGDDDNQQQPLAALPRRGRP